ncbi:hypothetical protein CEXT_438211 [Caerostris extrusa]|uniref:Uncharacterized protein n=1 Tax=Caerostris extrusa TaxID=172846 RepID=A0AAV4Y6Q5_CAEEX|nr:hypothetical protein CEXT_438211 [Caerostris extrusa]
MEMSSKMDLNISQCALSNTESYSPHSSRIDTAVTCVGHELVLTIVANITCKASSASSQRLSERMLRVFDQEAPAGNIIFRLPINFSWLQPVPCTGHNR